MSDRVNPIHGRRVMSELSNQRRENGRRSPLERARHVVLVLVGLVAMSACSDGSSSL